MLQVNTLLPWNFAYSYNANGHLDSQTYPGNLVVGYAPDALGRPTQAGTFATGVTYYPNGAIAGFTYGNGIVHSMTQNARQLPARSLDSYGNGGNTTKVLDDSFSYDANGNVLSLTDASNAPTADNRSWGVLAGTVYDGLDRLISVRSTNQWGALTGNYNAIYSYDPLDNLRTNRLGASVLTYGYNANNQLASLSYNGGTAQTVTSDARGNITANAYRNQAYQFDLAHRMNAVTGKESYLYDGHGRRARTLNLATGTIEYYGYGKDGRLLQDWSNRRQVRNGYVYLGNTVVGLYEVNLTNGTVTPKYQHTDALGSPVVTTNASKTVLSRMSYTPYGLPTLPMDGVGYTGHFMDVGTQLTYMQQRYYDPAIGRFLSNDPVGVSPNSGTNFNRYWYGRNSPLTFKDPDGRWACRGSKSECDQVADALQAVKQAADDKNTSAKTRSVLTGVLKFYGERGRRNGVVVSASGGASGSMASTQAGQTATGRIWAAVSFNKQNMSAEVNGKSAGEVTNIFATVLVHEAGHGMDRENNFGNTYFRDERKSSETKAFTNEAHFGLGSGYDFGGFVKGGKIDYNAIDAEAERATDISCSTGWSCL